jgi:acetolactate synthase I/II/III large subunit
MSGARERTGAQALVDTLAANGVSHVFCVPGESYLAVLDALLDADIQVITCRHEAAAANMAEAHGKLTGKPGVCMVTRGPGAAHAAIGIHTAFQDSTPLVMFVGQVASDQKNREAFQELDYGRVFSGLAKQAEEVNRVERMPEYVMRAFSAAQNGRPGPVVVALPEDVLTQSAMFSTPPIAPRAYAAGDADAVAKIARLLATAERPLLLVGGPGWSAAAVADLRRLAEASGLPIATSFRAKDVFDNTHPNYIGDVGIGPNPKLAQRVRAADVLIALGPRLGEMTTSGYSLLQSPTPQHALVHIHPSGEELGRVFQPTVAMQASVIEAVDDLRTLKIDGRRWAAWREAARADYEAWVQPVEVTGALNMSRVIQHLDATLPADAILTNGAGNFAAWLQHKSWKTQLAPTSGAMGYGLPAAIAAKIVHPERTVVCVAGDGDFLMAGNELATAVKYGANIIVLLVNNNAYGTIRMHQEREYPGRVSATDLVNPDFVAYAKSFGAQAWRVTRTEEFAAAFDSARTCGVPALIELVVAVEDIAPGKRLSQLGEKA